MSELQGICFSLQKKDKKARILVQPKRAADGFSESIAHQHN